MRPSGILCLLLLLGMSSAALAQAQDQAVYGRRQTFAAFFDYSNNSSHIILGRSPGRKFTELGFQYEYRLKATRRLVWKYTAEFRPLIAESDTTLAVTSVYTSPPSYPSYASTPEAVLRCTPASGNFSYTDPMSGVLYAGTVSDVCGRRWTYVEGLSPFGTRINLRPRSRWQPTASVLAGLLLSAKKIPIDTAGSFNFTFQLGAGVEYFRTPTQSIRLEYQIQHFSNDYTANSNPGVDNGLFKVTYTFGR